MRVRDKPAEAYGIDRRELRRVYELCRRMETADILKDAVISAVPNGLRSPIFISLYQGIGYTKTCNLMPVYCGRKDFYGYKRAAAAQFYDLLRMLGKWEYTT